MTKLGKKNLIEWGSTNKVLKNLNISIFTKKNIAYFISLALCVIFAFSMALEKEYFIVNINKTTQLYNIKSSENIANNYVFTIQNRLEKEHTFNIEVLDNENFEIKRLKPFKLNPNQRVKKVVIIQTKKRLFISDKKDTPLKIKVRISTLENKEYNSIRNISFIYPRNDLIK